MAVGRLNVFSTAAVAMTAGADFVVETAVYFVRFGAEDGGEVVRHDVESGWLWWVGEVLICLLVDSFR